MSINERAFGRTNLKLVMASLALAAGCSGGYASEGDAVADSYDDEPQEVIVEANGAALEDLSLIEPLDDPNHSPEELDEYESLLVENGGGVVEKIGGSCGSRNGFWAQVTTGFVPPDHFPPDSIVGLPIAVATAACVIAGVAAFHEAGCDGHDRCYSTAGRTKQSCDDEFRRNLRAECNRTYDSIFSRPCRTACRAVAQVMYEAVANFGDDAYADAQAHPYGGGAPVREPDPACVASCEDNCTYLQYDQIGICQYSCPDACR